METASRIELYTVEDVATRQAITVRQAYNVCRNVLGRRTRYRLTQEEFDRVRRWHSTFGFKRFDKERFN